MVAVLPGGLWRAGRHLRRVRLRALNGEDERFLLENQAALSPAERVTGLLARCLVRVEGLDASEVNPEELVRSLTAGDREALLLHLRRLTYGERMPCIVRCPNPACGEKMDLDLNISQLLLAPYAHALPKYQEILETESGRWQVCFRLPGGADQETAALLAIHDPAAAAETLLKSCILSLGRQGQDLAPLDPAQPLPAGLSELLADRMAALDPQAEIRLALTCTGCGSPISSLFDTASYLFQDAGQAANQLYQDVHVLALYYHWSESEILALPVANRQRYLSFLETAFQEAGLR